MKAKKRFMLVLFMVVFLAGGLVQAQEKQDKKGEEVSRSTAGKDWLTRTYTLKYVAPDLVKLTLNPYLMNSSYSSNGNMITVTIMKEDLPAFEKLLKQLDVEKERVLVRIFTVIASAEAKKNTIGHPDLQKVLNELSRVLNFKSFTLDGVSALTLTEGQRGSELLLSSHLNLNLQLNNISIRSDGTSRNVGFGFLLQQKVEKNTGSYENQTLVDSQTSIKENGYLVAGVSKIGPNGDSLVLIINVQKQ